MYGCIRPCMAHSGRGWEDREAACRGRLCGDVPFEFVGEVARASALAETSHVEGGAAAARHVDGVVVGERESDGGGGGCKVVGGDVSNGKLKDGFQPRFGRSRGRATSIASTKSYPCDSVAILPQGQTFPTKIRRRLCFSTTID
jgi:hypothetical protein